jgi:hypothetical protein
MDTNLSQLNPSVTATTRCSACGTTVQSLELSSCDYAVVLWVTTPCTDVVGYRRFGGPCCLHTLNITPCSDVIGHRRFGGPCCLHTLNIIPCSDVVGYRRFGGPCCLHTLNITPCSNVVAYRCFGGSCCLHTLNIIPCSYVAGYRRFRGPFCLHTLKIKAASSFETSVSYHITTWCQSSEDKCRGNVKPCCQCVSTGPNERTAGSRCS